MSQNITKTGIVKSNSFVERYDYLYLPIGCYVITAVVYNDGDQCKAETIIKYEAGGSGRDLMGYSASGAGYWGVTSAGAWEPHGTFSYTNSDITKLNRITYTFSSSTEHGTYRIGALGTSYSVRNKYIYRVTLYKNSEIVADLYPAKAGNQCGLADEISNDFYPTNNTNSTVGYDSSVFTAKVYNDHIEANEIYEI